MSVSFDFAAVPLNSSHPFDQPIRRCGLSSQPGLLHSTRGLRPTSNRAPPHWTSRPLALHDTRSSSTRSSRPARTGDHCRSLVCHQTRMAHSQRPSSRGALASSQLGEHNAPCAHLGTTPHPAIYLTGSVRCLSSTISLPSRCIRYILSISLFDGVAYLLSPVDCAVYPLTFMGLSACLASRKSCPLIRLSC